MAGLSNAVLIGSVRDVAAILSFRSLPVVAAFVVARGIGKAQRTIAGVGYVLASVLLGAWTAATIGTMVVAYAYFVGVALLVPRAATALRRGRLTRGGLFAGCAVMFLAVPCLALPVAARGTALIVGWDLLLSSYSYCAEVSQQSERPSPRECLFFLLVNPALVYAERGKEVAAPGVCPRALGRSAFGLLTMFTAAAVVVPACSAIHGRALEASHFPLVDLALFGLLRLLLEYWRQSGLASLQIGMLRQLGYQIPERYHLPFLATNPQDFWRRWNTYVGGWLFRYVFRPIASRYRGHGRTWRLPAAQAIGVVATFVVAGLLHDAYQYASALETDFGMSRAFVVIGVIVVLWAAAARGSRALVGRTVHLPALSRLSFWAIAFGCVAWGLQ